MRTHTIKTLKGDTKFFDRVRETYTCTDQAGVINRLIKYEGGTLSQAGSREGLSNPHITTREAIMIADYIKELEDKLISIKVSL